MTTRRTLLGAAPALLAMSLAAPAIAQSSEPIPVVATFSILGDMVERIGGEHVAVTTLVGPDGDAHVYQPTPADARAVSGARLLFVNGLDFEGWIDRLVEASDFRGTRVVATEGIEPIALEESEERHTDEGHAETEGGDHAHGAFDPHAWQSLGNGEIYVRNIARALADTDPANAESYLANADAYVAEMRALDTEIRATVAAIPPSRRIVVTSHDAFGYFAKAYGLTFLAPQGISTESEASAADVAALIRQIREHQIPAVFVETISDPRLLDQIRRETGAAIGGTLYSDALSGTDGPASTYLDMMRHNAMTLAQTLSS